MGTLTTLSRVMPKMAQKIKLILNLLKKTTRFQWYEQCEEVFAQLKLFHDSPPLIQKSLPNKPIFVYLSISNEAISSALVQEVNLKQRPVYFVSRMLQDMETRYQIIEKVALPLITTTRRMQAYFHNHMIIVKTDYPIAKILSKPDLAG